MCASKLTENEVVGIPYFPNDDYICFWTNLMCGFKFWLEPDVNNMGIVSIWKTNAKKVPWSGILLLRIRGKLLRIQILVIRGKGVFSLLRSLTCLHPSVETPYVADGKLGISRFESCYFRGPLAGMQAKLEANTLTTLTKLVHNSQQMDLVWLITVHII